jgi:tetratricopeptide repeat protein 30
MWDFETDPEYQAKLDWVEEFMREELEPLDHAPLDPYDKKLHMDTWYYAKRCFLALAENMSKHMLIIKDTSMNEILDFFDKAEAAGKNIATVLSPSYDVGEGAPDAETHNVAYEARQLKNLFMNLCA